jgi:hypothetical protein
MSGEAGAPGRGDRLWTRGCAGYARLAARRGWRRRAGLALRAAAPVLPFPPGGETAAPPAPLPRVIWSFWHSGEAQAPELSRLCFDSWRARNPGWELVVLDAEAARARLGLPQAPANARFFANLLRLELLAEGGGVWTDASVLCARPLDDWLPGCMEEGFFAFRHVAPDRPLASWFLASAPGGRIARVWARALRTLWRLRAEDAERRQAMHRLFGWMLQADPALRRSWARVPARYPWPEGAAHVRRGRAGRPPALQTWLHDPDGDPARRALAAEALADPELPMHKLDWRIEDGGARLRAALAELPRGRAA